MIHLESKTFSDYYGFEPNEYYLKFVHHDVEIAENNEDEYDRIKRDLKEIYNFDKKSFILYFSSVENYINFLIYIGVDNTYEDKIYLRIRNIDEYQKFQQIKDFRKIKIIVELSDINKLNITDLDLIIQIDKMNELPIYKLNELLKKYNIKGVLVGQIPYLTKNDEYLYKIMSEMYNIESSKKIELEKLNKITNDIYTIDEYISIIDKFQKILESLNIENKLDGFYKIFDYIARTVSYDNEGIIETKIENQNLIGPVFYKKSVCEGYSKYLQQLLSLIGIDSIIVQGGGKKEDGGHVWNQVLIDGKWYNADVTAASYSINNNEEVRTCLVKDDLLLYKSNTSISHICNENFETETNNKKL